MIATITPIYNPSKIQLQRYLYSIKSIKKSDVPIKHYVWINNKSHNIKQISNLLKSKDFIIKVGYDTGPDDALVKLLKYVSEKYIWLITCGESINLKDGFSLQKVINQNYDIIYGTTYFHHQNKVKSTNRFFINWFYKFRIPVLNLSCAILKKSLLEKAGGFSDAYAYASDYDLILRLYKLEPKRKYVNFISMDYYVDGRSYDNKFYAFVEMYQIGRSNYPNVNFFRNIYYFFYLIRNKISPYKFFMAIKKNYIIFKKVYTEIRTNGIAPYNNNNLSINDIKYLNILSHHYKITISELSFVLEKYKNIESVIELGSYMCFGGLTASLLKNNLKITESDIYKHKNDSKYLNWLKSNGLRYLDINLTNPYKKNKFDLILFQETLEHIPVNPVRVLMNVCSMQNMNGILILTVPNIFSLKNIKNIFKGNHPYINFGEICNIGSITEKTGIHWIEYNKKFIFGCLDQSGYLVLKHNPAILNYGNNINYIFKRLIMFLLPFIFDQHRIIAIKKNKS